MTDLKEEATNGKTYFKLGQIANEKFGVFQKSFQCQCHGKNPHTCVAVRTPVWLSAHLCGCIYPKLGKIGLKIVRA
jgi:hypothetical protein